MSKKPTMRPTPVEDDKNEPGEDAEDRRDTILRRMLNTPPKPKPKKGKGGEKKR